MNYHVKKTGSNLNSGTEKEPFLTIGKAAYVAKPGDIITIHEGIYREWVSPKSGGTSAQRIIYEAAEGENVIITGAEVITEWERDGEIWKTIIDNKFFGDFNPFAEAIFGDWLFKTDRVFHLGDVYLNGHSMYEAASMDAVRNPKKSETSLEAEFSVYAWYADVDDYNTTIYANFQGEDPTKGNVEINVRRFCFWPENPGRNYITVRGFTMKQAATQWAPPTALQEGLIGPHWSKGWIIENNIISDSRCSGISLGKEESTGQNEWSTIHTKMGHQREQEVIFRAVNNGWNKDNIGSHVVRNNLIYNCGQAGIVGHMGCVFSLIENNHIHHIRHKREFEGAEVGGIKLHAAIDTIIKNNVIHDSFRGVWLDWQAQGTRVCNNVMFGNDSEDILVEVSHGPTMIDHNILLSGHAFKTLSHSCALVHNLLAGTISIGNELNRHTPYHVPHSTSIAGMTRFTGGDDRYYNNIFLREKDDKRSDEPYLEAFFGNNILKPEEITPFTNPVLTYPVGTAVYNNCPGPDDVKPWDKIQRRLASSSQPPKAQEKEDDNKEEEGKPAYASLSNPDPLAVYIENNVYFNRALAYKNEKGSKLYENSGIEYEINREAKMVIIDITNPEMLMENASDIITTNILGYGFQTEQFFEKPDGTPYCFDTDFFGNSRGKEAVPGPFQVTGKQKFEFSFK
ncbi:right-handed parallel beta-helix repeat-containing protein [Clostridium sp. D46t1_190503_E9]|uniref:right-handed parallel beta-helix repeat-containing protein n=1 Tax=Clostridium sp. D46t1_190503_E9 TaxID=2787137 RepID=UPI001897CD42|nr:right-handed parallel beta-helix repeat-containing protein [Clostridium sp. D46t1_190503_E9]